MQKMFYNTVTNKYILKTFQYLILVHEYNTNDAYLLNILIEFEVWSSIAENHTCVTLVILRFSTLIEIIVL